MSIGGLGVGGAGGPESIQPSSGQGKPVTAAGTNPANLVEKSTVGKNSMPAENKLDLILAFQRGTHGGQSEAQTDLPER